MHTTLPRPRPRPRGSRLSSRPFYVTLLLLSIFTAYSFIAHTTYGHSDRLASPHASGAHLHLLKRKHDDHECRDVHKAQDQCAFVKQYCMDDDAGLIPYLQLYYCNFNHAQPLAFLMLVLWLGMLFTTIGIAASDFFSINLSTIATVLGLSESLAGVTFLAFGNGSPDVFSTFAAMGSNSAGMAFGELIGAASFITGVVAGSMALVREFRVDKKTYVRDIGFFVVAVAFTMSFLVDGHLHIWECCAMIAYYVLYVITVVCWHWYSTRRKERLRRERLARSHVYAVSGHYGDELEAERYRDNPDDEDVRNDPSPALSSIHDLSALERGPRIEIDGESADGPRERENLDQRSVDGAGDEEEQEEANLDHNKIVAAEVASSMRVLRTGGKRRNTITPIRPSLVGALEFRSALAQLQRESNLQLSSIPGRSYSENVLPSNAKARRATVAVNNLIDVQDETGQAASLADGDNTGRRRALSAASMPGPSYNHSHIAEATRGRADTNLSLPPSTVPGIRTPSPTPSYTVNGNLAPPPPGALPATFPDGHDDGAPRERGPPALALQIPHPPSSFTESLSPSTPFPMYTDSPGTLTPNLRPEPSEYPTSMGIDRRDSYLGLQTTVEESRPLKWWPHSLLPAPHVLLSTLFPTLQGWREKSYWDMFVSAISVPSIFLLVITLPVVESETTNQSSIVDTYVDTPHHGSVGHIAPPISVEPESIEPETEWQRYRRRSISRTSSHQSLREAVMGVVSPAGGRESPVTAPAFQLTTGTVVGKPVSDVLSLTNEQEESPTWNRWLVMVQLFTGPLFSVLILWANMSEDWEQPGKALVTMVLYSLLGSLIMLALLLSFTSETNRPKYHYVLCFLGFVISIAWISTIAGEVVGVLKTFGVTLDISEALLGLTIFAAGNSVGDLVADITVARLGFPVMALSACFGGPMLNILLGIGIGGVITMIQQANKHQHKHPDQPYKYGPFETDINGSLVLSAITLVIILTVLLISVPMNKWMLTRKIGWVTIAIWTVSTVVNVIVELSGVWAKVS
ncbi:Sodium/calcium exchanger protein-domain-containing protein [Stachybotrys elegans]|uniref:Sodium/calcium exchanger protein-domain-containing protein n=1 Tax=Stachybotrys elegans TaxID=80388 RepID=A0A8K0T206_9HYPO|nr:Sodium/calcium exchanger protein-domain-containing protein [Stachybotrys elegans]